MNQNHKGRPVGASGIRSGMTEQGFAFGWYNFGLSIATFLTLFVVPIVYIIMDRICVKFTGHSSAHGLIRAAEIDRETAGVDSAEPAHSH